MKILQTEIAMRWVWSALRLRDFDWHGIDPTQRLAFLYPFGPADLEGQAARQFNGWRDEFAALGLVGERIEINDGLPGSELVDAVVAAKPAYLQVQPTALQIMVGCDAPRLAALGLRAIFSFGEEFPPEAKRHIEQLLGCKVLELYGSAECNYVAGACPYCGNFHIHAEANFVEAIDGRGQGVPAGETGRLLVTPFYNYAMPLIRYDHEDFVVAAKADCRVKLPALSSISGKKRDPFVFPNGRVIRPTPPTDDIVRLLGARIVQVAQVGPERCEVRVVPGSLPSAQMRFEEMTQVLRKHLWSGLQVDYRIVDGFPRPTPRAKFKAVKQEFYNPADYLDG